MLGEIPGRNFGETSWGVFRGIPGRNLRETSKGNHKEAYGRVSKIIYGRFIRESRRELFEKKN